ncbi:type II toxin-antitoxin system Phd/YefM family antitoxin [Acetobacterium sp.]|uniref:type II toxin-antitoxin system Phd/YefM family antitoxin n=1 Tax=Acetobacterium sp. TaxID=1872094 RepID=UPI003593921B
MLAINYTTMRNKMKSYFDKVTDDCETIIVTRKGEKNVVLISLDEYNNLIENAYITSNKAYYDRLIESKKQIEQGKTIELEACDMNDE